MPRGRPPKLTHEIAAKISKIQKDRERKGMPLLKAPAVRKALLRDIRENSRKQGKTESEIRIEYEKADKQLPGNDSIRNFIRELTKKDKLNEPFSIASLENCPISPEAIPAVLRVWEYHTKAKQQVESSGKSGKDWEFTIRMAKWAARLSGIIKDTQKLSEWAYRYADAEYLYGLLGHPFDSTGLDQWLLGIPITGSNEYIKFLYEGMISEQGYRPSWENKNGKTIDEKGGEQ